MFFDILYNTHYASITMGLDFVKSVGYIQIAESLDKTKKPNQIQKGEKIYDYDNAFYMNILPADFTTILLYLNQSLGNINKIHGDVTIYTDLSKSSWGQNSNIGKKTLWITDYTENKETGNKQRLIGNDGQPFLNIVATTHSKDGSQKRSIYYKAGINEILRIKAWAEFGCKMLPGFSAFLHQITPYFTNKSITELRNNYTKMKQDQYNNNSSNNSGGYSNKSNAATFDTSNNSNAQNVSNNNSKPRFGNTQNNSSTSSSGDSSGGQYLF